MIELSASRKVKLIGMMKMGNAKYDYQGNQYTAKALLEKLGKKARRCRKLNAHYHQIDVSYKGHQVRLFFSKFGNQAAWQLILSTDTNLNYLKTIEKHRIRWSVEVFFKEVASRDNCFVENTALNNRFKGIASKDNCFAENTALNNRFKGIVSKDDCFAENTALDNRFKRIASRDICFAENTALNNRFNRITG